MTAASEGPSAAQLPGHVQNLIENVSEVTDLLEFHRKSAGVTRGRKFGVEVLNKSAVVLLVACWEAYIEDLARSSFGFLVDQASAADAFPIKVRVKASEPLRTSSDDRRVWALAGDGWKTVLRDHRDGILHAYLGKFNTAKAGNIDKLYEDLLGMPHLSHSWKWRGMTAVKATAFLDGVIAVRGDIAHRAKASTPVHKSYVKRATDFVSRVAVLSSNRVAGYLKAVTKTEPWVNCAYDFTPWEQDQP